MLQRKAPIKIETSNENQWTVETLREYLLAVMTANDTRYAERFESSQTALQAALASQQTAMQTAFAAQKLSVDAALAAADRAVNKAEMASDKRFDSVNEFRATLADQQRTLMPRSEAELLIATLTEKIDSNTRAVAETTSQRAGASVLWGYLVGAGGVVLAIIFHFVK